KNSAIDIRTSGGIESAYVAVVCHACIEPPCAKVCPTGALVKRKGGGVVFHKDLCTGCEQCVGVCLVGAIHMDGNAKAIVCKHCGICTSFCPHEVLEMRQVGEAEDSTHKEISYGGAK
ncbi:MAG: 4Fe-4S binding protein, partial [Methanosarcinaceae archaeon]|nr:4Fe-4S binding protein [Methanosarcinaceae archaeon]